MPFRPRPTRAIDRRTLSQTPILLCQCTAGPGATRTSGEVCMPAGQNAEPMLVIAIDGLERRRTPILSRPTVIATDVVGTPPSDAYNARRGIAKLQKANA